MCHVEWEELDWSGFNFNRFSLLKTTLLRSSHKEKRPWTHNIKAECLCIYVCIYMSVPACVFIGGKGTSWATWNPRGNRDWPSRTQGKVCHPIVLESEVMRAAPALISLSHTPQGDVGVQGRLGPPGPQGLGEPGPPVGNQHTHQASSCLHYLQIYH